jgi:hypothetical protein
MASLFDTCPACHGSGYLEPHVDGFGLEPQRAGMERNVTAFVASLEPGKDRCRSSYEIARDLGIAQRSVGFVANYARRRGHLVGSVHGEGYYLIVTEGELDETIRHIRGRVSGINTTIAALAHNWKVEHG